MEYTQKNLETFNLKELHNKGFKPEYYSFDKKSLVMIRDLTSRDRAKVQNILNECYHNIDKLNNFKKIFNIPTSDIASNSLISNILCLIAMANQSNTINLKLGIYASIFSLRKFERKKLNNLRKMIFLNIELKSHNNSSLIKEYKRTFKDYNDCINLFLDDKDYNNIFDNNITLDIIRRDILNELNRRCKVAKKCKILNKENIVQGFAYFIPRTSIDDEIIILYNNNPFTISDFKKTNLITNKINGKIYWE